MALRWAGLVTVAITGPRIIGSAAPHWMAVGLGPCPPGWEVRTILAGLARGALWDADNVVLPQDIQVASGCSAHLVVIFLRRLQNSTPERPVMSPWPNFESLLPPNENGSR